MKQCDNKHIIGKQVSLRYCSRHSPK